LLTIGIAIIPVAFLVILLLSIFGAAIAVNLLRGKEMSCGCFGASSSDKVTWFAVVRNVALITLGVLVVASPPAALSALPGTGGATTEISNLEALAVLLATAAALMCLALGKEGWQVAKARQRLLLHSALHLEDTM
jgi:hypothetical protein